MEAYDEMLADSFEGREPDITEENLQARIRGNLLMALSNKFGWLVLTTGNKSENSVGYSTLYGDSAGGFAVIKDVPKTLVYRLVDYRNARDAEHPVPRRSSTARRAPSCATTSATPTRCPTTTRSTRSSRPTSRRTPTREQLERAGFPREAVDRVIALVDRAEYKRRQAPPGIKITPRAFGRDRRMPITNAYRSRRRRQRTGRSRRAGVPSPITRDRPIASVAATSAHRRGSSSSVMSTSHTHVVRPRWRRRAVAWIVPPTIGRRKLVWFDRPIAVLPSSCDGDPGGERGHGLGHRGEDAAVHEARRAGGSRRAPRRARRTSSSSMRDDLETVEAVEADRELAKRGIHERAAHYPLEALA